MASPVPIHSSSVAPGESLSLTHSLLNKPSSSAKRPREAPEKDSEEARFKKKMTVGEGSGLGRSVFALSRKKKMEENKKEEESNTMKHDALESEEDEKKGKKKEPAEGEEEEPLVEEVAATEEDKAHKIIHVVEEEEEEDGENTNKNKAIPVPQIR